MPDLPIHQAQQDLQALIKEVTESLSRFALQALKATLCFYLRLTGQISRKRYIFNLFQECASRFEKDWLPQ